MALLQGVDEDRPRSALLPVAETENPYHSMTPDRLGLVEKATAGYLPSRLSLGLAQSSWSDLELGRAAKLISRQFDLDPAVIFEPYRPPGGIVLANVYTDPVTGGPISLETARRFVNLSETRMVREMLRSSISALSLPAGDNLTNRPAAEIDPGRVTKILRAFAPVAGTDYALTDAMGAALVISRERDLDVNLLTENLEYSARLPGLTPALQIAAAHQAAKRGRPIRTLGDVATALEPAVAPILEEVERARPQLPEATAAAEARGIARVQSPAITGGETLSPAEVDFMHSAQTYADSLTAGLAVPGGDWLDVLQDSQNDYIKAGKELSDRMAIPFADSVVGRGVISVIDLISRPVGAVERLVFGVPVAAVRSLVDPRFNDEAEAREMWTDAWNIVRGRTNVYEEMADEGVPVWAMAIADLAIGVKVDPFMFLANWRAGVKASRLLAGTAGTDRAASSMADINRFLDQKVRRIGDLRDLTIAEYLVREADRVKRPAAYFDRAVNNFRTSFTVGSGIDSNTAARIWRFNEESKKLGLSYGKRVEGVRDILAPAMGLAPRAGSVAEDIHELDRVLRARRTDEVIGEIQTRVGATGSSLTPGSELAVVQKQSREAHLALGALSDAAGDFDGGIQRMLEIPHFAGALGTPVSLTRFNNYLRTSGLANTEVGRVMRSVLQTKPRRFGARVSLEIEDAEVARDFERALLQSQVLSPEEVALAKREFGSAIDRRNPTREMDFKRVVGIYNERALARIHKRYGIDDALAAKLQERLANLGGRRAKQQQTFAVFNADEAQRIQLRQLRKELRGTTGDERAAIEQQIRDLEHGPRAGEVTTITDPFLRSQFDNTAEMMDFSLYRLGIAEMEGTLRKWTNALRSSLGGTPVGKQAIIPVRRGVDAVAEAVIQDLFLAIWKPLAVLRPAYILRVVGLEEQSRFLATAGLFRRLQVGKRSGTVLEHLGLNKPVEMKIGVALPEGMGARGQSLEDAILFLNQRTHRGIIDDIGFSRSDTDTGSALADVILTGGAWDDAMRARALEIAGVYPRQLETVGIDAGALKVRGDAAKNAAAALERQRKIDDGVLTQRLPGIANEPLVNAGQGAAHALLDSAHKLSKELGAMRGDYVSLDRSAKQFDAFWWNTLVHQFGTDPMGNRILTQIGQGADTDSIVTNVMKWLRDPKGEGPAYAKGLLHGAPEITDDALEYQLRIAANYAAEITAGHPELATAAALNELDIAVLKAIPPLEKPLYVHGPEMAELFTGQVGGIKKFRDFFGRWILQEPTNRLSRQPYFRHWYDLTFRSLVENARAAGRTPEAIRDALPGFRESARQMGIAQVRRIMFDFSRTGRVEEMTRFGLVFVQPFLEFPLVWGRITRQNPAVIGHAIRLGRNAMESGFIRRDEQTGELVIPMSWWAGAAPLLAAVTGGRLKQGAGGGWSLSANLSAFNMFAQGAFPVNFGSYAGSEFPVPVPSLAPPLTMAMQAWSRNSDYNARLKSRVESWLFQYGEVSVNNPRGLMPAWLKHAVEGAFPELMQDVTDFNTTHFLQLQEAMGIEPDVDKARGDARAFAGLRVLFSWFFPGAPTIDFPTEDLENEYRDLIDLHGPLEGRERFLSAHPENRLITIARTMWEKEDPDDPLHSPAPIPATRLVQELLATKGARKFAEQHPEWVWAIIPQELADPDKFDPGIFFAQIAEGSRKIRTPGEFLQEGDRQSGWDAYFDLDEDYRAHIDGLEAQNIGEGDPTYERATDERNQALEELRGLYPEWWRDYKTREEDGVSPRVLATARALVDNRMFRKTEVGKWLSGFLPLYDRTRERLADANLRTLNSVTAQRLGITPTWEAGLAALNLAFPQGEQAYRLFFSDALQAGIRTTGDRFLDRIPDAVYDSKITPWWSTYEERRADIDLTGPALEKAAAYGALRQWVNGAYDVFSKSENPMILRWETWNPSEKASYLASLVSRSYQFNNRFDRETVLGEATSPSAEARWTTYEAIRLEIQRQEETNPDFSSSRAYEVLDAWVLQQAVADPTFAEQVTHANTWGWAFEQVLNRQPAEGTWGFLGSRAARPSWDSLLAAARQYQVVADTYELHGIEDSGAKGIAYRALMSELRSHVQRLSDASPAFAAEYEWLDKQNGPDDALAIFMPEIYYRLGGTGG